MHETFHFKDQSRVFGIPASRDFLQLDCWEGYCAPAVRNCQNQRPQLRWHGPLWVRLTLIGIQVNWTGQLDNSSAFPTSDMVRRAMASFGDYSASDDPGCC